MTVIEDTPEYQVVETITPNGRTVQTIFKAGSSGANREAVTAKMRQALAANKTFLALGPTPTAAQVRDQTIRLTHETQALLLDLLNDYADITDT